MDQNNSIESSKAPEPVGLYPHAKRVGNLLFLSGVGPRERGTKVIPGVELDENRNIISYDIAKQCHSVFQNIKYILEDSGSSWDKIVDVTVFLTNMKDDFPIYNKIWAEYFSENPPCRTTLEINCLPTPIGIVKGSEIKSASNRSNMPPWPGKILPESFILNSLFSILSTKSPKVPNNTLHSATVKLTCMGIWKKCANTVEKLQVNTKPPIKPSHVLPGETASNILFLPNNLPLT